MSDPDQSGGSWTLLTGHGHVLVEIARDPGARIRDPGARIRDLSAVAGLTERTVQAIVADLEAAASAGERRLGSLPEVLPHSPTSSVCRSPNVTRLAATRHVMSAVTAAL